MDYTALILLIIILYLLRDSKKDKDEDDTKKRRSLTADPLSLIDTLDTAMSQPHGFYQS